MGKSSSDVVVQAPMSYTGSRARLWRMVRGRTGVALVMMGALAVTLTALAWTAITGWYLVFGLFLGPYRLVRRGSRKRKREELRHQEMMQAVQQGQYQQGYPPQYQQPHG